MTSSFAQLNDLNNRKITGKGHLSGNRVKEALLTFANLIRDYPVDYEAYLILGDLYLAGEMFATALDLYQKALSLDPSNQEVLNRINLAKVEGEKDTNKLEALDVRSLTLLQEVLSGNETSAAQNEVDKANELLDEIIHSSNPAELVARHLDQIEDLLPALLELNIRQAKVENRPDLVSSLENLQMAISEGKEWPSVAVGGKRDAEEYPTDHFAGKVVILVPDSFEPSRRASYIHECLTAAGCTCNIVDESNEVDKGNADIMIACNPHINPWLLEYMAEKTAKKTPIILDLDRNFEEIPVYHPDYLNVGLGSPANARAYSAALLLCNLITVPSRQFAVHLNQMGYRAASVHDGWSRTNSLWNKTSNPRNTINIGWLGNTGMLEDIMEIRRIINRVIREFPRTQLVISENSNAFQLFNSLPDNRKLFIPEVSQDDYPFLLGQMDILAVPMKKIPFNETQPDTVLMEAGVKRIPWVGSRIPSYMEWNTGGLLADSLEEWHTNLRQLVMDTDMRIKLGDSGIRKAQQREMQLMKSHWIQVIDEVIKDPAIRGLHPAASSIQTR